MVQPGINTDQDAVEVLAHIKVDCPGIGVRLTAGSKTMWVVPPDDHSACESCSGEGKVRRFPGLSRECPCDARYVSPHLSCSACGAKAMMVGDSSAGEHSKQCACGGSGLVPVSIPEAVYWLEQQTEFYMMTHSRRSVVYNMELFYEVWWRVDTTAYHGEGPTIIQALARAIMVTQGADNA